MEFPLFGSLDKRQNGNDTHQMQSACGGLSNSRRFISKSWAVLLGHTADKETLQLFPQIVVLLYY